MYRGPDRESGSGARIYRERGDIIRDIESTKKELILINEKLDIKELLFTAIMDTEGVRREKIIPVLEAAIGEAEKYMLSLKGKEKELSELREELYELRCERGH